MVDKKPNSYASSKLTTSPNTEFSLFREVSNGRDRFGNRKFSSPDLAYTDKEGVLTKATLLVSDYGERFLKTHSGVLSDIDEALVSLDKSLEAPHSDQRLEFIYELKHGGRISFLSQGGLSLVYLLEIDSEKYVLKVHKPGFGGVDFNPVQPYINEMLQSQAVTADLKESLDELGVRMPTFLFASGQVSCTKFEDGEEPSQEDFAGTSERGKQLEKLLLQYIHDQNKEGNPLWHNVGIDHKNWYDSTFRTSNFIKRKDGTVVWIDPFIYLSKGERAAGIIIRHNKVLLIHNVFPENDYWTFPGGTIEKTEGVSDTIKRKVLLEAKLEVNPVQNIFDDVDKKSNRLSHFVICELSEKQSDDVPVPDSQRDGRTFSWVDLEEVPKINLVPSTAKEKFLEFMSRRTTSQQ